MKILTIILYLLTGVAYGQTDRLILKNRSVLVGEVKYINNDQVAMEVGENTVVFDRKDIVYLKVKGNKNRNELKDQSNQFNRSLKNTGFKAMLSVGLLVHESALVNTTFGFSYRFHHLIQPGIALGYDQYEQQGVFPLMATWTWSLNPAYDGLFVYTGYGYGWLSNYKPEEVMDEHIGGRTFIVGVGSKHTLGKVTLLGKIGYKQQRSSSSNAENAYYGYHQVMIKTSNSVELGLGVIL